MDNQHRKIVGYRELSQEDIDLMNRIKAKGAELLALQVELVELIAKQKGDKISEIYCSPNVTFADIADREYNLINAAEPFRWAAIGKKDIQTEIGRASCRERVS